MSKYRRYNWHRPKEVKIIPKREKPKSGKIIISNDDKKILRPNNLKGIQPSARRVQPPSVLLGAKDPSPEKMSDNSLPRPVK